MEVGNKCRRRRGTAVSVASVTAGSIFPGPSTSLQATMSFADLQSSRKTKESKSFVRDSITESSEAIAGTSSDQQPQHTGSITTGQQDDEPVVVRDLDTGLPPSLDVRTSETDGRGIYANRSFAPGLTISTSLCVNVQLTGRRKQQVPCWPLYDLVLLPYPYPISENIARTAPAPRQEQD